MSGQMSLEQQLLEKGKDLHTSTDQNVLCFIEVTAVLSSLILLSIPLHTAMNFYRVHQVCSCHTNSE